MRITPILAICALLLGPGCGRKKKVRVAHHVSVPRPIGSVETGTASWYGHPYHGRTAASGEIYNMENLTAAHRTLPFGTWVRVHNLENGKNVEVRVNDRGPFYNGRVIDLSHAAAGAIDMIGLGVARVRIEVIAAPAETAPDYYAVQVGAFQDRQNAERVREQMEQQYGSCRLVLREGKPPVWRVLVGAETTQDGANALAERLRKQAGEAFVVRLDSTAPQNRL